MNNKLGEIYIDSIEKAREYAETIASNECFNKSMAYSNIAIAIALQMSNKILNESEVKETKEVPKSESKSKTSKKSEITKEEPKEEPKEALNENSEIKFEYDEDGVPILTPEDEKDEDRLIAYAELIERPDIKAKLDAQSEKRAKAVMEGNIPDLSEDINSDITELNSGDVSEEYIKELENYKNDLAYEESPELLDSILCGMTGGQQTSVANIESQYIKLFVEGLNKQTDQEAKRLEQLYNDNEDWYWAAEEDEISYLDEFITEGFFGGSIEEGDHYTIDDVSEYLYIEFVPRVAIDIAMKKLDTIKECLDTDEGYTAKEFNEALKAVVSNKKKPTVNDINEENVIALIDYLSNL